VAAAIGRRHFRDVDIASSVDTQGVRTMKPIRESAPGSVGTKFQDWAPAAGHHWIIHDKEIASCVKGQVARITNSGNKGTFHSIGCEFEN
jgi:hypothetical protein